MPSAIVLLADFDMIIRPPPAPGSYLFESSLGVSFVNLFGFGLHRVPTLKHGDKLATAVQTSSLVHALKTEQIGYWHGSPIELGI